MIERLIETLQVRLAQRKLADPETLKRVAKRYAKQSSVESAPSDPLEYIQRIALPGGKPYRLATHNDLIAIAQDDARILVVRKAAQKGVTELMIRIQFYLASQGYNTAYFLRSRAYMRTVVQSRIEPVIAANPELIRALTPDSDSPLPLGEGLGVRVNNTQGQWGEGEKIPPKYRLTDNTTLKRLYGVNLLYMGLQNEADVRSFPLDAIFVDEVETLKPELTVALQERLYHSSLKWERWFSQPTAVNYGIDERFQLTDQRHQMFRCQKCNHEFTLEHAFPNCLAAIDERGRATPLSHAVGEGQGVRAKSDHAVGEGQGVRTNAQACAYICPRCHAVFDPLAAHWQWVALYPSRSPDGHGYHLTQLYSHTMHASEIARLYRLALRSSVQMERFVNSVLGLPYAGGDTQPIHPDKLAYHNHPLSPINADAPRYAGVDVGDTLSVVIIEQRERETWWVVGVYELQGASKWDDLRLILQNYRARAVGVNAMPYKDSAKRLLREIQTSIAGALIYDTSDDARPSAGVEDAEFGDPVPKLTYPRTELMDATVHALLSHAVHLPPRHLPATDKLLSHLQNYIVERDAQGKRKYARGRQDHLGRALDYALAVARWQGAHYIPADILTPENLYTPIPLQPQIL